MKTDADEDRDDGSEAKGVEDRPLVENRWSEQVEAHDRSHRDEEKPPGARSHVALLSAEKGHRAPTERRSRHPPKGGTGARRKLGLAMHRRT
jgi:hypothetical protein